MKNEALPQIMEYTFCNCGQSIQKIAFMRLLTLTFIIGCVTTVIIAIIYRDSAAANLLILLGLGTATVGVYLSSCGKQ